MCLQPLGWVWGLATKQKLGSFPPHLPLSGVSWLQFLYPLHAGKVVQKPHLTPPHPVMAQSLGQLMPLSPASVYSCSPPTPPHPHPTPIMPSPAAQLNDLGLPGHTMSLAPASAFTVPCDWKGLPQSLRSIIPICYLLLNSASAPPTPHPRRSALSSHGVTSPRLQRPTVRST